MKIKTLCALSVTALGLIFVAPNRVCAAYGYTEGASCSESNSAAASKAGIKKAFLKVKDGVRREYYENGNLKSEEEYKDNKKHGTARYYNEVGGLYMEEDWDNGQITGHRGYDLLGKLDYEVKSINNGIGRAIDYDVYGNDIGWFWMTCDENGCRTD